jgi:cytochrome P450
VKRFGAAGLARDAETKNHRSVARQDAGREEAMSVADAAVNQTPRSRAYALPLEALDPGDPDLFLTDSHWPYFERLRREDPVHWCAESAFGPYWSVTRFKDILAVETGHLVFSSAAELGGVTLYERGGGEGLYERRGAQLNNFIASDPPNHAEKRKVVQPAVAPAALRRLEPIIRARAARILDELPVGATFNWVEKVSVELTIQMLATLLDFPFEDRHKLARWSDVSTCLVGPGAICETEEARTAELQECLAYFTELWRERTTRPGDDLISMLVHNPATRDMTPAEFMGMLVLLIVGGNDTTRNTISGGVLGFNRFPAEYEKVRARPDLLDSAVPEIIRWQTPVAHMRRTALEDIEFGGKTIRKGDKVVMWYVSGNRDEEEIARPDDLIVDREQPRHHVSFGFGIHRCVGNRLAELQLRIVWEEILERFRRIEVMGEPQRVRSNMIRGYQSLPVRVHPA